MYLVVECLPITHKVLGSIPVQKGGGRGRGEKGGGREEGKEGEEDREKKR